MADENLGQLLIDAGWDQGVLLPPLASSVHFLLTDPITKIARMAKNGAEKAYRETVARGGTPGVPLGFGFGIMRPEKEQLVIASQACDIVSDPHEEPTVLAMRVFITDNTRMIQSAATNSSRYFLLDPDRNLIADAGVLVQIEKPLLLEYTPAKGVPDEEYRQRFARWIGHRFTRPPIPEPVVAAVVKPVLDNLREMQENNDTDLRALDGLREWRLVKLDGQPPYAVRILFVIREPRLPDEGKALARLIRRMRVWFDPAVAQLAAWDARDVNRINLGDYLGTWKLNLDYYSYQGRIIRGLTPPEPL